MSDATTTGPGTVIVAGTTYLVDKMTSAQCFALYEHALEAGKRAYNPFKEVCEALTGLDVSPEQKMQLLTQAQGVIVAGEVPGDVVSRCLRSCEGVAFQLWLLSRKNHPELTYEYAKTLITEDNRIDVYVQLDSACGANVVNKAVLSAGFTPPA